MAAANPLGELLRDAAEFVERFGYARDGADGNAVGVVCVGCGIVEGAEPAHESTCPVAKLVERLRFAEVELGKAAEAFARAEPAVRKIIDDYRADGTHESRPGIARAIPGRIPVRFRLLLDPETHRAKVEPGDQATADWLLSNRVAFQAEQSRALRGLDLRGEMTEELVSSIEQALLGVARALDPRADPVVERYRPAKPPTSP